MKKFDVGFFSNIIGLPERRNKRKSVLEIKTNVIFFNLNYKIIEQEMNKVAIHTHVIFRPLYKIHVFLPYLHFISEF